MQENTRQLCLHLSRPARVLVRSLPPCEASAELGIQWVRGLFPGFLTGDTHQVPREAVTLSVYLHTFRGLTPQWDKEIQAWHSSQLLNYPQFWSGLGRKEPELAGSARPWLHPILIMRRQKINIVEIKAMITFKLCSTFLPMAISRMISIHWYGPINEKEMLLLIIGQYFLEEESTS